MAPEGDDMTRSTGARAAQRVRCGKCGSPGRWGETCVVCGASYTQGEKRAHNEWANPSPAIRVAHGITCAYGGELHKCHCQGGKTHPCQCYESPGLECHICGTCSCEHLAEPPEPRLDPVHRAGD